MTTQNMIICDNCGGTIRPPCSYYNVDEFDYCSQDCMVQSSIEYKIKRIYENGDNNE